MSERIHVLAQQLFGKASVDECDLQEVKDLANHYPYFAPAQFLLLEKLKKESSPEFAAQLQKAVLYYHNPLEFEYLVSSGRFKTEIDFDENFQSSAVVPEQEEAVFETTVASQEIAAPFVEEVAVQQQETVNPEVEQNAIAEEIHRPEAEALLSHEEVVSAEAEKEMAGNIEKVLEQEEQQLNEPVPASTGLSFEPYHTVDYFASQGIKLSQDETPKDKFGRQLKSFTEWLKTMKRLPAKEISQAADSSTESKVQHLAADSVHEADVITEAMAEVWIKQGNREKAIETYNKLGLLNPSKKAYFAALIDNLKRS